MTGAIDVLLATNEVLERKAYEPLLFTHDGRPIPGEAGRLLAIPATPPMDPPLDSLFIVTDRLPPLESDGLPGVDALLRATAAAGATLGGFGNGAAWLAHARLLRGYRCTVAPEHAVQLAEWHPDTIVSSQLYEIDRNRLSCAAGTASLDLMIAWMGRRHGEQVMHKLLGCFALERLRLPDERPRNSDAARAGGSSKLQEAMALMEANIGEPLTTDDIARLVGLSRRQLERLFKQHVGALPSRWYLELRLERARRLLQQTPQSVLQIGLSCGFASAPHFSNAYRKRFGHTPRDARSARAAAWRQAPEGRER